MIIHHHHLCHFSSSFLLPCLGSSLSLITHAIIHHHLIITPHHHHHLLSAVGSLSGLSRFSFHRHTALTVTSLSIHKSSPAIVLPPSFSFFSLQWDRYQACLGSHFIATQPSLYRHHSPFPAFSYHHITPSSLISCHHLIHPSFPLFFSFSLCSGIVIKPVSVHISSPHSHHYIVIVRSLHVIMSLMHPCPSSSAATATTATTMHNKRTTHLHHHPHLLHHHHHHRHRHHPRTPLASQSSAHANESIVIYVWRNGMNPFRVSRYEKMKRGYARMCVSLSVCLPALLFSSYLSLSICLSCLPDPSFMSSFSIFTFIIH